MRCWKGNIASGCRSFSSNAVILAKVCAPDSLSLGFISAVTWSVTKAKNGWETSCPSSMKSFPGSGGDPLSACALAADSEGGRNRVFGGPGGDD